MRPQRAPAWIAFAGFAVACACYWPGSLSGDSIDQLGQARAGRFNDWHPPIMAWLWSGLDRLRAGPAGMLVLHNAAFWFALATLAGAVGPPGTRRRRSAAWLVLAGFLPPIFGLLGNVWKDVGMASALLLGFALTLAADRKGRSRVWLLPALLALFYAAAVRHDGIVPVAPLAVYWARVAWAGRRRGRAPGHPFRVGLALGLGLTLCVGVATSLVNRALTEGRRSHPEQQILLHDLVAVSLARDEVLVPPDGAPGWPSTIDELAAVYAPSVEPLYWGDPTAKRFQASADPGWIAGLRASWLAEIPSSPGAYLAHRGRIQRELLGLHGSVCRPFQIGVDPDPLGLAGPPGPLEPGLRAVLGLAARTPLYRGWLYALMLLLLVAWEVSSARRRRPERLALATSGLALLAAYSATATVCDFRFLLWPAVAACVGVGIAALDASPTRPDPSRGSDR